MKVLIIFVAVAAGVCIFLGLLVLFLWLKFKTTYNSMFSNKLGKLTFNRLVEDTIRSKYKKSVTPKEIMDSTKYYIDKIKLDFPDFDEKKLFSTSEEGIKCILEALNNNNSSNLNKFPFLKYEVEKNIKNNIEKGMKVKYSEVVFHKFSIQEYKKINGVATILVGASLEYFYDIKKENEEFKIPKYKVQTRYKCQFIYVYNPDTYNESGTLKVLSCPNCGAPIRRLDQENCEYCGCAIIIDGVLSERVKSWELNSYKEY